jgi:xanthine dehydrogenase accessory factor
MKDILADVESWRQQGLGPIALATVLQTWGSSPRKAGAKMAFTAGGAQLSGSVSGGCVEGAVISAGEDVLAGGLPQLLHFGVADETAWEVGLACGGEIEIFVQLLDAVVFDFLQELIANNETGHCYTIVRGPEGVLGRQLAVGRNGRSAGDLPPEISAILPQPTNQPINQPTRLHPTPGVDLFVEPYTPAPTLVIVGGVHIAIALAAMAKTLGFRTVVVDPRRAFGSDSRFPHADQLIQLWPKKAFKAIEVTPETAVALLTHDPKIDDPALEIVLNSPAFYIGALGSRKTHAKRVERLQALGLRRKQIARIQAPIGLDIRAQTPEEIALSIMAQIIQAYRQ